MTDMTPDKAGELRKAFPKSAIGKLPKAGMQLDYVGHAAVTDRLLSVDPEWKWEPFALDENGLPALDRAGNLWIRLTICGVTRIGVGDGKSAKEIVGDALRNASMRFGVALDLWSKEELEHSGDESTAVGPTWGRDEHAPETPKYAGSDRISEKQTRMLAIVLKEAGITERDARLARVAEIIGRQVGSSTELTKGEASKVLDALVKAKGDAGKPGTRELITSANVDPWGER